MSQLFYTERGRVLLSHNEEITRWRWVRKELQLPDAVTEANADLWLFLQMYEDNRRPLHLSINGQLLGSTGPDPALAPFMLWHRVEVPAGRLTGGVNRIELRCDTPAMNGWMLGIENGHCDAASFLSTDRGQSWQNKSMGIRGVLQGEYIIRLRSHSDKLADPPPPPIAYEDPNHPRVKELLELVPASIRKTADPQKQIRMLRTWVAKSWGHRSAGTIYSPWDPWTILDWAKHNRGHGRGETISMCVHFATLFVPLATALGHRARCVIVAEQFHEATGHFMTEVWDDRLEEWILHDPNYDVHYVDGKPLSAVDIADRVHAGKQLQKYVVAGKGMPKGPPRVTDGFRDYFASGRSFRITGVWARNEYVSQPAVAPPNHGSVGYCETDIVWYDPSGMNLAEMFPYRVPSRDYFDHAPTDA